MSQENVELVRRYLAVAEAMGDRAAESTSRRLDAIDLPEVSAFFEKYWHPQAVYDVSDRLDGGIYDGPAGVEQSVRDWLAVSVTGWPRGRSSRSSSRSTSRPATAWSSSRTFEP
jgi:hypothetical protein